MSTLEHVGTLGGPESKRMSYIQENLRVRYFEHYNAK